MNKSDKSKINLSCAYLVVNTKRASKMGVTCWVSVAGGTFNAMCGYLSRKYNLPFVDVQVIVDRKMTELLGNGWYQYMFDTIGCDIEYIDASISIEQLLEGNF